MLKKLFFLTQLSYFKNKNLILTYYFMKLGESMRFAIVSIVIMSCIVTSAKIYVPTNYETIQSAIDNASEGEEIIVKPGIYEENLRINKSIILKSENGALSKILKAKDRNLPVIRGEGSFDDEISVKIIGFTIKGGNEGVRFVYVKNGEISDNLIRENRVGVHLDSVISCSVQKNRITMNDVGVEVEKSLNVEVWLNSFESNSKDVISENSIVTWHSDEQIEYEYNNHTQRNYIGNFWSKNECKY